MKKYSSKQKLVITAFASAIGISLSGGSHAAEPGLPDAYPLGNESYMTGALPPPGVYGMVFVRRNDFDSIRDRKGDKIPVDFKLTANVIAPRLVWVPGVKAFGGDLVLHAIAPLVDLDVKLGGTSQSRSGLGDMVFGIGSGYHLNANLHVIPGIDVIAPTGRYEEGDLANLGNNRWSIQPLINLTCVDPAGFNGDLKVMYTFNGKNTATGYRSGDEFIMDFDAGYGLGNGWVVGVGGYFYRQLTSDRHSGHDVPDSKGRSVGFGPALKYDSGKGWFMTVKWQKDSAARNRVAGDSFVVKAVFPL